MHNPWSQFLMVTIVVTFLAITVMDIDKCIERLQRGLMVNDIVESHMFFSNQILAEELQVLKIMPTVTVYGDIRGQFYDLKELLKTGEEFLIQTIYFGVTL